MARSIATGALRPKVAVLVAGALNLVGAFLSVEVAKTISSGLVDETRISPVVIFAGLVETILLPQLRRRVATHKRADGSILGT
jgi:PiT family inorganic phosphate transporter